LQELTMTRFFPHPLPCVSASMRPMFSTAVTMAGLLVVWCMALVVLHLTARDYADPLLAGF
jgi:hypothetical protein